MGNVKCGNGTTSRGVVWEGRYAMSGEGGMFLSARSYGGEDERATYSGRRVSEPMWHDFWQLFRVWRPNNLGRHALTPRSAGGDYAITK